MHGSTGLFRITAALGSALAGAGLALALLAPAPAGAQQKLVTIGPGGSNGVY